MTLLPEPNLSIDTNYLDQEKRNVGFETTLKRVSFHTLGCRLNQSETNVLSRRFKQSGYRVVPSTESADISVSILARLLNTVMQKTDRQFERFTD